MSCIDPTCGNCKWMEEEVCVNYDSEFVADFVLEDDEACVVWDPAPEGGNGWK